MRGADCGACRVDCGCSFTFHGASSSTAAESRRCTCQINALRPSSHPGNRRPSICRIFARNLHSIDPTHDVYDAHPRRCTSHSMHRADPAKGSTWKCDRLKVAGCLGCEVGLKELKPRQLYERLLRQSVTGRCVWSCENESDAVVWSGDHRSRRERGGVTGVGMGARHWWWLVSA